MALSEFLGRSNLLQKHVNKIMIDLFYLFQILNEIAQHKIKIYEFPECDDEEENKVQKKLRVSILYDKCSKILNTFGFQSWNSENACHNSKQ